MYYVGSEDWILPHVRADADALDATVDVIAGQSHLGGFFDAVVPVLAAVTRGWAAHSAVSDGPPRLGAC